MIHPRNALRAALFGLLALFGCAGALADDGPAVQVNGIRNPELKPYRVMLAGLDAFDAQHALAPNARALLFKLRPTSDKPASLMDEVALRVAGDTISIPLPLAADGTFTLPRNAAAEDQNADLVLNKKKGDYRWDAEIRSDGVPADMRRLGDLRLQCEVVVAVAKKEIPFWMRAMVTSLLLSDDWCGVDKLNWGVTSPRALKSAVLVAGERRLALPLFDHGKSYTAPTSDKSFPDDALIELQYADDAAVDAAAVSPP